MIIFRKGFELAFDLLNSKQRTACQSVIVFITDGRDSDGETVRCGEGEIHFSMLLLRFKQIKWYMI